MQLKNIMTSIFVLLSSSVAFSLPHSKIQVHGTLKSFDKKHVYIIGENGRTFKLDRPSDFDPNGYKLGVAKVTLKADLMAFVKYNKKR